jgi:hypothetical protein
LTVFYKNGYHLTKENYFKILPENIKILTWILPDLSFAVEEGGGGLHPRSLHPCQCIFKIILTKPNWSQWLISWSLFKGCIENQTWPEHYKQSGES